MQNILESIPFLTKVENDSGLDLLSCFELCGQDSGLAQTPGALAGAVCTHLTPWVGWEGDLTTPWPQWHFPITVGGLLALPPPHDPRSFLLWKSLFVAGFCDFCPSIINSCHTPDDEQRN